MSPFEYVSVLISLVIGLGIALILTGVAGMIKHGKTLTPFAPYFIWIALVFMLHVHEWWEIYQLRTMERWSLPAFLFVISYPVFLFILANLLFPEKWNDQVDLKEFYFSIYRKFFFFTVCLVTIAILQNIFLFDISLINQPTQLGVLSVFTTLLIWRTRNIVVHTAVAILMLMILIFSLIITQDTLLVQ